MEHFVTICGVLNQYLSDSVLPNTAELLGIYGRVCHQNYPPKLNFHNFVNILCYNLLGLCKQFQYR